MPLHVTEEIHGKLMEVHVTGKLERADYEKFVPDTEKLIREHGRIRLLVVMEDFHGWHAGAFWEDLKWDVKHFADIERVAVVGETKWQEWMTLFCRPFTIARVRFFEHGQREDARAWLTNLAIG